MKKALSLVLCISMFFTLFALCINASGTGSSVIDVWDGSVATGFAGGDGSAESPYEIATAAQLAYLAKVTNDSATTASYAGKYFKLTSDIWLNDISGYDTWTRSSALNIWTPIGAMNPTSCKFAGSFDGNGHTIYGMYTSKVDANLKWIGLFGRVQGDQNFTAEVKNLRLVKSFIGASYGWTSLEGVGGIAGDALDANIINCTTDVKIDVEANAGKKVGGVVGQFKKVNGSAPDTRIENCINIGNVKSETGGSNAGAGGFAGQVHNATSKKLSIIGCVNYGTIEAVGGGELTGAGGMAGYVDTSAENKTQPTFTDCVNYGTISSSNKYAAGMVAVIRWSGVTIKNCVNVGEVTGKTASNQVLAFGYGGNTLSAESVNNYYNSDLSAAGIGTALSYNNGGFVTENMTGLTDTNLWTLAAGKMPTLKNLPVGEEFTNLGAQIREKYTRFYDGETLVAEGQGLRFGFTLNNAAVLADGVTVKVIISTKAALGEDALTYDNAAYKIGITNSLVIENNVASFAGYLVGIDTDNLDTEFVARACVMYNDTVVMYSDEIVRSVAGVAETLGGTVDANGNFVAS